MILVYHTKCLVKINDVYMIIKITERFLHQKLSEDEIINTRDDSKLHVNELNDGHTISNSLLRSIRVKTIIKLSNLNYLII